MQQSLPDLDEAPSAVLCDLDALPSLRSSVALPYAGWDFGIYRLGSDRLLILEETYVLEARDWRTIRDARYEDVDHLVVRSGHVLVAPLNDDLVGIEKTARAFAESEKAQDKHGELEGAGVLARIDPGAYVIRRARADLRRDDCAGAIAFLLEKTG